MHAAPSCLQDAVTCLKRRLQMDHPQKQYLAIILTSKVGGGAMYGETSWAAIVEASCLRQWTWPGNACQHNSSSG